ncbi:MAG TPA: CRTAC1 family protein [Terracidiphilus sp.]|nr:CRTAC1 family protein [Terracidiphilus sp.]
MQSRPAGPFGNLSRRTLLSRLAQSAFAAALPRVPIAFAAGLSATYPFEEIPASKSGIAWVHDSGRSPQRYLPESSGPGCAFLDYDNDGWMDIYFVNSGPSIFYHPAHPPRNALYRNNRDGTFTDVTLAAGVAGGGFGQGVAVGDYNGDGFPDLYVTQCGENILYRNNGNGTFTDVTESAGVAAGGWSTSAVWFDYDNDGALDLFVCQFAAFELHRGCATDPAGHHHYCIPKTFDPMPCRLFHNNGNGTFTDVSKTTGIADHLGKAWSAVAADLNNDGRMDLFVSNDTVANFLFMNRSGKFEETGLQADVAYSADGRARSGMGVDAVDYNQDGLEDLFVANIDEEFFSLYKNNGDGGFDDVATPMGIGMTTRWMSGWGLKFIDYDNDGDMDLIGANGFPDDLLDESSGSIQWRQKLLLFHREGKSFRDVSAESGPLFTRTFPARGLAVGDFDNDGGIDVLIGNNDAAPLLLRNKVGRLNNWLGVHLIGRKSNPDAIGAVVTYQAGDLKRSRMKIGGGSFLSSHDPRMILGIGRRKSIDSLEIRWPQPSGAVERITDLPLNRYITIVEGTGKWK